MKISDLLRDFADTHLLRGIADAADEQSEKEETEEPAAPTVVKAEPEGDNIDAPDNVFIPPLQQKIEMLKKATGVENVYDDEDDKDVQPERHSYPNVMTQMRKNAGLNPTVLNQLVHDDPIS